MRVLVGGADGADLSDFSDDDDGIDAQHPEGIVQHVVDFVQLLRFVGHQARELAVGIDGVEIDGPVADAAVQRV